MFSHEFNFLDEIEKIILNVPLYELIVCVCSYPYKHQVQSGINSARTFSCVQSFYPLSNLVCCLIERKKSSFLLFVCLFLFVYFVFVCFLLVLVLLLIISCQR